MIKNGQRPVPNELTSELEQILREINEFRALADPQAKASDLLIDLIAPASVTDTGQTASETGTLLRLGEAFLLPMEKSEVRRPDDISMTTNGVLGNHLEVRYTSGAFGFVGRERHFLKNMVDDSVASWTEVEAYRLDSDGVRRTRGFGFTSDEGIQWLLPPGDVLRWQLNFHLPRTTYGYLYLAVPSHLPQCYADRILSGTDLLYAQIPLGSSLLVPLSGQTDRITVDLSQKNGYLTTIGHSYKYEALTPTGEVFTETDARRIPGPYPTLRSVGAKVASDQRVSWTVLKEQTETFLERPDSPLEVMTAWRYAMGIADVALLTGTFAETGELIVGPFTWTEMPARIRLDAVINVPTDWGDGNWVETSVSANQSDWYRIAADGVSAPREYAVGEIPVQEELTVIPAGAPKFWVRVRLHRKSDDPGRTPIISNVQLVGEM